MINSLILIIDMQNDYCHKEGYYSIRDGTEFTMDKVADRIVDFYWIVKSLNASIVCFSMIYNMGNNPCLNGSWGSNYYKIKPDLLFEKNEFDCFSNEGFVDFLNSHKITRIFLCGFQITFCIFNSLVSAVNKGYEVYLVTDLIGERKKHYSKIPAVIDYAIKHAQVCTSKEVINFYRNTHD